MPPEAIYLILCSLLAVPLTWMVRRNTWEVLAIWTFFVIFILTPASIIWLIGCGLLTSALMYVGDRYGHQGYLTSAGVSFLIALLISFREIPNVLWIGGAYFTLRSIHVLLDWWMDRITNPGFIRNLRYQLFLPTLISGPINRLQVFERQIARRRYEPSNLFGGAERLLFGLAQVVVLGGWFVSQVESKVLLNIFQIENFFSDWIHSALNWVEIYFVFAGYSSIALGLSLMMGLRLEENFNRPWAAKNLIDFWLRWHMTLSLWVRDYVFQPVTALTRSPVVGVTAAMLAIGLWHETTMYYVLWALWQAMGIVLTRTVIFVAKNHSHMRIKIPISSVFSPVFVLGWLSLAHPVVTRFLELFP